MKINYMGTSKNPNNLDDVRFLPYSDFFKVRCSQSYIQFKKIAVWLKYGISYLFWVFRGPHIVLFVFIFYSCGNNESISCDKMIYKKSYKICYSYKHKGAKYVSYTLDGDLVDKNNISQRLNFYTEKELKKEYQSKQVDYLNSGYDKGHLASDASFDYDLESLRSVYSMANIIPQDSHTNRYTWIKTERLERELAVKFKEIDVFIGVIYGKNPKKIGNDISVPYAYYKKLSDGLDYKKCFYFKNRRIKSKESDLENYEVNCDSKILELG